MNVLPLTVPTTRIGGSSLSKPGSNFYSSPILVNHRNGNQILKEVIQPQVPLRLPCYDFTPITDQTVGASLPKVGLATSGPANFRGVTGGVYKARERIHRGMLIRDY